MKIAYWYRMPAMWRRRLLRDCNGYVPTTDVLGVDYSELDLAPSPIDPAGADTFDSRYEQMHARAGDV